MFATNFLNHDQAVELVARQGTPLFVYAKQQLVEQGRTMLSIPAPYGLTVRYAMKANSHPTILQTFHGHGLHIDASSGFEVEVALQNGFKAHQILLTTQQLPPNLKQLIEQGVLFDASSLHQLEEHGRLFTGGEIGVRLNPGVGSGHSGKTSVGGPASSFGIWHEHVPHIQELVNKYRLKIVRLHTHIGSGTDPAVWHEVARVSLELMKNFPEATTINLGGGFKVARMDDEQGIDMVGVGQAIAEELKLFARDTGRKLHLELEPGTFLTANAGILLSRVEDIVDTGETGYSFIKLDTGMNDILRPSMYGAQHPIAVLSGSKELKEYVVVGHNCESTDLLTPAPNQPDILAPRHLNKAHIGDVVLIGGVGAYCASMSAKGYNGFPSAKEVML